MASELATAWSLPFKVRLDGLKARGNVLEIEVTNLAVEPHPRSRRAQGAVEDHARDQPRQRASIAPFDAAGWEIAPAGLLGPVTLVPLARVNP